MRKLIGKYRALNFEQRILLNTVLGLCVSSVLTAGKLLLGIFTDFNLCIVAVYTASLLLAKLECVLGAASDKPFRKTNAITAGLLFAASAVYIGFMCRTLVFPRERTEKDFFHVGLLALISFIELGFALAGIFRTKNRGQYYRNIKIINFCVALIALLTSQIAILDYTSAENVDVYNACTGICVGAVIAVCAVYILISPAASVVGREHNVFVLKERRKNAFDLSRGSFSLLLCKSRVYGSYYYLAHVRGEVVEGDIVRSKSLWKRMPLFWKIVCCVLSEVLIPAWLIGRFVFFLRSAALPQRLEKWMGENGFERIGEDEEQDGDAIRDVQDA